MLPKTSAYAKTYDREIKWMYFLIEGDDLLRKCNTIWHNVSADINKIDNKPVCNKEYSKTKRKISW